MKNETKKLYRYFIRPYLALFLIFTIYLFPSTSLADTFTKNTSYTVCFTPGENCEAEIVDQINQTRHQVLVQAYSFTSVPILSALVAAKERGVSVRVILDKSQYVQNRYSSSTFLDHHSIPVWIDAKPAIAHNKVMIIDDKTVITGSFNFTKAAQYKNAENLLIFMDPILAKKYLENWVARQTVSLSLADYANTKLSNSKHSIR